MGSLAENLEAVHARIAAACARAGRAPDAVRLLAVSKTYGPDAVRAAAAAGQRLFGENRVQEAAAKIPECPGNLEWHLIGHLQSNKAALAARLFDWVHSVDSAKLLKPAPASSPTCSITSSNFARASSRSLVGASVKAVW